MNKTDKIIIIFYIFLASSYGLYVVTYDVGIDESLLELVTPIKKTTEFEISRLVDVPNNRIFDVMANVENFPNILPENVVSVNILNKTDNEIIAEEELFEAGIKTKLLVKHTIKPYSQHIIEIIDGDAEGTKITQYFESVDSQTKLTTKVNLNVKGVTSIIAFLPEANLVHAMNTIVSHFVEYSKYDVYEITVNALYQEILDRQADEESLLHFSTLLRDSQITEQDLRDTLLNSEERATKPKTIDQLNEETINVINDLYEKILLREADPVGLIHFGNLFESGMTSDKIRVMLLQSEERKIVVAAHPVRTTILPVYEYIFDRQPDNSFVHHYVKVIDCKRWFYCSESHAWIHTILAWEQNGMISADEVSIAINYLHNEGIIFPDESRPPNEEPQITEQDLRDTLLNSEERATKPKTIDQLNEETINVINDLYEKILLREADPVGLIHFGNLFESGMTSDKIRVMLLQSEERKIVVAAHPVRTTILPVYEYIFDRQPDNSFVHHYVKVIDCKRWFYCSESHAWIHTILAWEQNGMISADEVSIAINYLYNEGIIFPDERPLNEESVE